MRRTLSILLVVFFGLGPLAATLPGSDDSSLPACCRRLGKHHCSMGEKATERIVDASPAGAILSAPAHCPLYPGDTSAVIASVHALAASLLPPAKLETQSSVLPASRLHALSSQGRIHAVRGPPTSIFG